MTAAGRTGGGGAASDRMRETKEERAEWAAEAGVAGWVECQLGRRVEKIKKKVGWVTRMTGPK
jgi:hypothetical protein